ncbi:MAG: hypothetical protein ACFFBD_07580 [Candidatus Hodarchaeota archaeon]
MTLTVNTIKKLIDQGKYQAVVDQLAQWEADGILDTFTEAEQTECIYYQSFALSWGLEQWETAVQHVLAARQKHPSPTDRRLLLALFSSQIIPLCQANRLDEALEVITEGNALLAVNGGGTCSGHGCHNHQLFWSSAWVKKC